MNRYLISKDGKVIYQAIADEPGRVSYMAYCQQVDLIGCTMELVESGIKDNSMRIWKCEQNSCADTSHR